MSTGLFDINALKICPDLLFEFFFVFSKFEFSLKNSGFLVGDDRKADPDWDRFASSLKHLFASGSNAELKRACEYIELNPPMKQVVVDGRLAWGTAEPGGISVKRNRCFSM